MKRRRAFRRIAGVELRALRSRHPEAFCIALPSQPSGVERRRWRRLPLIALFAAIGMVLVTAGIYALMSTFVTQRHHEIGVRMALGADARGVVKLVIGQGGKLMAIGTVAGIVGVLASTRLMEGLLFAVSPRRLPPS